jgi:hypothetical protein
MTGMTPTLTDGSMPWRAADVVTTAQMRIADNDRFCRLIRFLCSQRPWHNKSHCMPWLRTSGFGTTMLMLPVRTISHGYNITHTEGYTCSCGCIIVPSLLHLP